MGNPPVVLCFLCFCDVLFLFLSRFFVFALLSVFPATSTSTSTTGVPYNTFLAFLLVSAKTRVSYFFLFVVFFLPFFLFFVTGDEREQGSAVVVAAPQPTAIIIIQQHHINSRKRVCGFVSVASSRHR